MISVVLAMPQISCGQAPLPLDRIKVPPGFAIELVARVPNARGMTWGDKGTLFVGSNEGSVYALTFAAPNAGGAATVQRIASGLREPAGVAFRNGSLYVSAISRILRYDGIEGQLHHRRRRSSSATAFQTTGITVGNSSPSTGRQNPRTGRRALQHLRTDANQYANIQRMNADGSAKWWPAACAPVGFDWDPRTKDLEPTSNGRDMMGDDVPPDTLNHLTTAPQNFGYPYCHGGNIPDPEFGGRHACSEFAPPAKNLGPHVATLGMRFYTGTQFPAAYRNQIFIAEHGSWNRSHKIGYRVTLVRLDPGGKAVSYEPFAEGWLQGESAWGRPADVLVAPDGSLLVSDDSAGAIYRIRYKG
jgi:glucose/arabinose dehydrogenase